MADDSPAMEDDSPTMEVTKEYFDKVRASYTHQAQADIIPYINQAPIGQIGVTASLEEQRNQHMWYLTRCIETLQEARKIQRDEKLMKELREFIRRKRDELAITLDEIG